jgi:catechol-2,3-dioxygenase
MGYKIPEGTRIGHVHLKVTDLERSLNFTVIFSVLKYSNFMVIVQFLFLQGVIIIILV